MGMTDDTLIWPFLTDLAAQLQVEIEDSGLKDPCWIGVLPGSLVALDYCAPCGGSKCGMAWVRLAAISEWVDETGVADFSRCNSLFTATFEMGIVRCHQTSDDRGNPMSMAYQAEATRVQLAEMAAMKRVLLCSSLMANRNVTLGGYQPIGPDGSCVGGSWSVLVDMF
jgi:hypothetical protein